VTRLLAEEGLFFFFEHPGAPIDAPLAGAFAAGAAETLVIADDPSSYPDIAGATVLPCKSVSTGGPEVEGSIQTFLFRRRALPESVMQHDHDYRRPLVDLTWTSYPAGPADDPVVRLSRIYEHHSEYEHPDASRNATPTVLEQHQRKLTRAWGTSPCRRLAAGHTFTLDHAEMHHLSGKYVVHRVEHNGHSPWTSHEGIPDYIAIYRAVSAFAALRPARPKSAPRQVVESAVVVGPAGEEVHTDELGRVKVQFHWDRLGGKNEKSSCFLRVAQPWAGAGFGFQFLPRVGTEVLVGFLGGDLDNPVVVGGLHNVIQPPPIPFPASRTQSCIRSRSTPGGMGYNEIAFDDNAGQECLWVRAERDLRESAAGVRVADVGGDDTLRVGRTRSVTIGGDERVGIGGDQVVRVEKDQHTTIRGNRTDTVYGAVDQVYEKDVTSSVFGDERRSVGRGSTTRVGGSLATVVSGDVTTIAGGDLPSSLLQHAEGLATLFGGDGATVESPGEVLLRCGKSSLRLTPSAIEIVAPEVVVRVPGASVRLREGEIDARAKERASVRAGDVLLRSSGARLLLGKEANLDGDKVKIGCDASPGDDTFPEDPCAPTKIELRDDRGQPIAGQRYIVEFGDGTSTGGLLGKDGSDELLLERDGRVLFPDIGPARPQ
jgi:type VI secretion system secreted protein VgrG